jgi:predicted homoserine dehydrogenase-like protein
LRFAPVGVSDLAHVLRPAAVGGKLDKAGEVEVVSSLERDGRPVADHLRWGIFLVLEAPDDHVARALGGYGLRTDVSGHHAALTRPVHLAGLEMTISVASAALRGEPTGAPRTFNADVVTVAKRDLAAGEMLDGDGGACAWGMLLPAATSRSLNALPIGLSRQVRLTAPVPQGEVVTRDRVALDDTDEAVRARRAMTALMSA